MDNKSSAGEAFGIISLVVGIVAIITAFIPCFGMISVGLGIIAVVFGSIGYYQAKNNNVQATLPMIGLILGGVATLFSFVWYLMIINSYSYNINSTFDTLQRIDRKFKKTGEEIEEKIDRSSAEIEEKVDQTTKSVEKVNDANIKAVEKSTEAMGKAMEISAKAMEESAKTFEKSAKAIKKANN